MWKILINSKHNRMIVLTFSFVLLINLFSLISENKKISNTTNELIGFLGIPVTLALTFLPSSKKNITQVAPKKGSKNYVGILEKDKEGKYKNYDNFFKDFRMLKRENHRKIIIEKIDELFKLDCDTKGLIITGDSGAGKSVLLNFLISDLKSVGYLVYNNDKYNVVNRIKNEGQGVPATIETNKKYVLIFDQFEEYINYDSIEKWLYERQKDFKNCVFVFSFPQRFLSGIYEKLYGKFKNFYLQTYVLHLDSTDMEDLFNKVAGTSQKDAVLIKEEWKKYQKRRKKEPYIKSNACTPENVLLEEIYEIKCGNSPLIEMELLGEMVENSYGVQDITRKNFIECYFDNWVSRFNDKETAYAILALFTQFESYGIEDFKLVTFDSKKQFDNGEDGNIIAILDSADFLTGVPGSRNGETTSENNKIFIPRHEYVCRAIQTYLASKEVPIGIRNNVEYYRTNSSITEYKNRIKKRYDKHNKGHVVINILLYIMLIVIFVYNILSIYSEHNTPDTIFHRVLFSVIGCCSVFYVYNYCKKIMWIGSRAASIITCFIGWLSVVLSYIFPNWWGICLGIEIIVFSLCVGFLATNTTEKALNNLSRDARIFFFIGIIILFLGIVFANYFSNTNEQFYGPKYSYYPLFIIYVLMSDINHIRPAYIKNKIGYINMFKINNRKDL